MLDRVPRASAAAILASAISAFVFTGVPGAALEGSSLLYAMLLCAAFTAIAEIAALNNSILLISAAVFVCVGGALFFVPSENGSICNALLSGEELASARVLPIVLLLCGALCLVVCVLHRSFAMRCIIAGSLVIMLIVFVWLGFRLLTIPAILIMAYILIVLCQICARRLSGLSEKPRDMWFVMFSLITAVLVFVMPYPNTRIQWEKLFEIKPPEQLVQLGETLGIEKISDSDELAESTESGYSEDQSSLSGWLELVSDICLQAEFSDDSHADRLTGSIYDCYIGTGWMYTMEIKGTGYISEPEISLSDIFSASDLYGSVRITEAEKSKAQYKTLFYPPYSHKILSVDTGETAARDGVRLIFKQPTIEYDVYYPSQKAEYKLTAEERESYLALPDELPSRVKKLALKATEGCENDEGKAQELMRILADCTYETYIRGLPKGRDLVDYFLFDSQKGYCAYFASAMTVMARCVGIPSRYVQGYYIGSDNGRSFTVTSDCAHAWAELYIDGRWIVYDPATSPMENITNTSETDAEENKTERNNSALRQILLYSYGATAAAAVIFVAFRPFFRRFAWRIRIWRKYGGRSVYPIIAHCGKLLWVLSACGMKRAEFETLTEFGMRVREECPWIDETTGECLSSFLALTGKVLYSSDDSAQSAKENLAGRIRKAYVHKFGYAKYLRGHRRASL